MGQTFLGWADASGEVKTDNYLITGDTTLTAKFTTSSSTRHNVSFWDGLTGEFISYERPNEGAKVAFPAAPEHEGYKFVGWVDNSFIPSDVDPDAVTMGTSDARYKAMYEKVSTKYTVTFADGVTTETISTAEYEEGETINFPTLKEKPGYQFVGWVDTSFNSVEPGTLTMGNADMTIIALWKPIDPSKLVTVTFKAPSATLNIQVAPGTKLSTAAEIYRQACDGNPTWEGKEFIGWANSVDGKPLADDYVIEDNIQLIPVFKSVTPASKYAVTFRAPGAEDVIIYIDKATTLDALVEMYGWGHENPTADGYTFVGWAVDGMVQPGDFLIDKDTVLTPVFQKDGEEAAQYSVTFTAPGQKPVTVTFFAPTALDYFIDLYNDSHANPYLEGYTFRGWALPDGTILSGDYMVPEGNVVLNPVFEKNPTVCTITFFDAEGNGLCTTSQAGEVEFSNYVAQFVESGVKVPHVDGYVFDGWVTKSGDRILLSDTIATNLDVYASYRKAPKPPVQPDDPDVPNIPQEDCPSEDFIDVDQGLWYHEAIDWAIENGVMTGYDATHFGPNDVLTRAQVARVLYNMAGQPKVDGSTIDDKFTDCGADDWYADAVVWAVENGIFTGYEDGEFGPNDAISREQIAVVFWRLQGEPQSDNDLSTFPDGAKVSDWATEAVEWANEKGLLKGYDTTGELNPTGGLTRAECATVTMRYVDMFGMEL